MDEDSNLLIKKIHSPINFIITLVMQMRIKKSKINT